LTKLEKKVPKKDGAQLSNIHSFIDYLDSTADFENANPVGDGENNKYIDESIINIAFGGEGYKQPEEK